MLFESNRLEFRILNKEDVHLLQTFWGDEEVMAHCGGVHNPTPERFLKTILFYDELYKKSNYTVFAVIEKESNNLIGAAGFNPTDDPDEIELIYHFAKKAWGKGYGSEAALACLNMAKNLKHISKISASVDMANGSSKRILEKIGFTYQGLKWFEDTQQEEHCFYYLLS